MMNLKQELSYLMLGQQGGENRIKILESVRERSYNINQLSNELKLNYRTIKHHIDILLEHDMIESSGEGYGDVYFITPKLEKNYALLKEIESKLHTVSKSPELYEKIREQTRDGLILLDEAKDVIFLNKRAMEITHYRDEELLGKNITEMLKSEIYDDLEQAVLTNDEIVKKNVDLETKNGDHITVIITMDYFHFDHKNYKGFSLLLTDITTERRQSDILEALMKHSDVMMAYLDANFHLLYANSAYAEQTDYDPTELVGMNHFNLFPNGENKRLFEQVIKEKKKRTIKDRDILVSDGSDQKGVYWSLEPVEDGKGHQVKGLVLSSYKTA